MHKIYLFITGVLLAGSLMAQLNDADKNAAIKLVDANKAAIGITTADMNNFMVSSTFEDNVTGIRYVYLIQAYKGIPVFNQMTVLSFRAGKLLTKSGVYDPGLENFVNNKSGTPSVTAESAVQSALEDRGFSASQMAIALSRSDEGRMVEFGDMGISRENITAQLMWVPDENFISKPADVSKTEIYKLAWQIYFIPKTSSDYWLVRVNAVDNSILGNTNLTVYDNWGTTDDHSVVKDPSFDFNRSIMGEDQKSSFNFKNDIKAEKNNENLPLVSTATYRVIPIPFEAPSFMPGASTIWHAIRSNPWTNATVANAVTLNWHTGAGATDYDYSRGNNVWAYEDRTAPINTGSVAKSASSQTALPTLTFDFTPDYTQEPIVNTVAIPNQPFNITNLFYWNNIIHDVFYGYGFTEAGGNFQDDNLGRGGVGLDHVNAEAQDGSGTNGANFSTPPDGGSGRMQMFLWAAPTPDLDGGVDNGIIVHEFGHGISKRITGGPANVTCLSNAEQGGEGISDYFALMLTQDWATATVNTGFNSPRGIGTYVLDEPTTGAGFRPQRYTTNMSINTSTYATLPSQAIPLGVGWVWCSMLWEMTWEVINEVGAMSPSIYTWNGTEGNVRALRMVMEGLRTQPCQPGFVDARNNILLASQTLYGGIYDCAIWRAFARRGVGFSASQGSSGSITDQVPAFDLPPACLASGPPTVTINQGAGQADPTGTSPINFTVVFSEAVTDFTNAGVNLSGTAGATTSVVTGGPTTYNVAVSGMTGNGTVVANIPANAATGTINVMGNLPSTSTDNIVTFNLAVGNDVCSGALPIACGQTISGTTVGATLDAVPTCTLTLNTAPGLWYTFVGDGLINTLSLCGSGYDTKIGVYSGTCAALVCVIGNDDFCGLQSQVTFSTINATTYYVLVTGFGTASGVFTLTRTCCPPLAVDPVSNQTLCNGASTTAVTFSGSSPGTIYTWTNSTPSIGLVASGTGNIASFVATNAGTAPVLATITVTPTFAGCSNGSSTTFTITVNSTPSALATPSSQSICNASAITPIVLTSGVAGTTYAWARDNAATATGIAASGSGNISGTLTNTTNAPITVTFTITPTINGCPGPSTTATVTVNPTPTINLTTSIPQALLPTQVLTITATTAPAGGSYLWFKNGVVIPGVTGNTLASLTVSDIGTYYVVYTDGNGCVAISANIDISGQPSDNLYVYPVPNQGVFNVRFYNQANEQVTITVLDAKGGEMYSRKVLTTIPYTTINVDLSTSRLLASGTYVVDVRGADGRLMGSRKIFIYNR